MMSKSNPAGLLLLTLPLTLFLTLSLMVPLVLAQQAAEVPLVDIFAVRSWEPPPVVTAMAAPAPPPAPEAPPLPFRFLGRIVDADRGPAWLLDDGSRVIVVAVGDPIGKNYRVEKYENGRLVFRYRPMNVRQALDVGEKK